MQRRKRWILAGTLAALAVGGGSLGIANATSGDAERPITGPALERASAAALAAVGPGHVSETEVGDEDGYYEVEVTLDRGGQVDVHLNEDFTVASQVPDVDTAGDSDQTKP